MASIPELPVSRAMVADAVRDPARHTLEAIAEAVAACDFTHAAALAFARASVGLDVPIETIAAIVPGTRDADLVVLLLALAPGGGPALLASLARFPHTTEALTSRIVVLFAAWRRGADVAEVVRHARLLARYQTSITGYLLLGAMERAIGDENLTIACSHLEDFDPAAMENGAAAIERAFAFDIDRILKELPETLAVPAASGFTIRTGPRVGRNEPCPCGSGLKYKKCCADKQQGVVPSPVAGLSWDDYVRSGAHAMSAEDIDKLPLRDLARVDLNKLADHPLIGAFRRFTRERWWRHAERAVDVLASRRPGVDGDEWRDELIAGALDAGELALAQRQLALVGDADLARHARLELALRLREDGAFDALLAAAEAAVRDDASSDDVELAHLLLRAAPGLGILVARGCFEVDPKRALDCELLLDVAEEARIDLRLPTGDKGWDVFAALYDDDDHDDDEARERDDHDQIAEEARLLRASLRDSSSRVEELERELASQRDALATARQAPPQPDARARETERERERTLATKIERLEGLVREGIAERSELRQQLAAKAAARAPEHAAAPVTATSDPAEDDAAVQPREVLIPMFDRRATDALADVPHTIAAEAMRHIGTLAAGDAAAWRRVKQAKDMSRQVLMARVGIHHRLLLRVDAARLHVLDLVTREALDTTLKRLRANG